MMKKNIDDFFPIPNNNIYADGVSAEINSKESRLLRKWRDKHPNPYRGDSVYIRPKKSSLF